MATIDVAPDLARDVTYFTVAGDLTAEEIIAAMQIEYARHPTTHVLWDLTQGSLNNLTADNFRRIAGVAQATRPNSPLSKTVYVGTEDQEYGLMRMYIALAESAGLHVRHAVFRTREEAMAWLGLPPVPPPL